MMKVNMHEAKSQLSRLGKAAWEGEEVVIAKAGEPYLRLVPYRKQKTTFSLPSSAQARGAEGTDLDRSGL